MLAHPRLAIALIVLRPDARPLADFVCQDDGDGPFLVEGSMVNPPTQEEIDSVTEGQLNSAQRRLGGPLTVSAAQAKLALYNAGLYEQVQVAIAAYPPMKIYFDNAPTWNESHPYVLGMAAELGILDQIGVLFDAAYELG